MVREPKRQIEEMNVPEEHINGHAFHTYRVVSPDGMCVKYNLLMPTLEVIANYWTGVLVNARYHYRISAIVSKNLPNQYEICNTRQTWILCGYHKMRECWAT